ncbi:MAG: universal stress protein [Thermobispora bispora]|uniref:universal stress protein n=1 Tax=Thermobispora bispora TaxID=2006 RepID=UPI0019803795|nr:universal stress protein [Thermobispora bispora]MBO2474971.1 universal stress protein UspA [Actinomycetales bacterium]MBX6166222.1 universal stress protein [Thermobispora bispora]MDI9581678.1 universal stress protein [Thermobispora sp.]QSI48185.1 universal stress protein [Thermobispora bispora]
MTQPIVVATDGSPAAAAAVTWAADDAVRKGLPLRIVHVLDRLPYDLPRYEIPDFEDRLSQAGRRILDEAAQAAREGRPGLEVTTELLFGDPAHVLRDQAGGSAELVMGSRGLGGFRGMLLGSVSANVAGHAEAPVVVVRATPATPHNEIVVGFDGSEESKPALVYAFEAARLRGCPLRVIYAYQIPVYTYAPVVVDDVEELRRVQEDFIRTELESWRDKHPEVETRLEVVCSHPVTALVEASEDADLLVVGSHGRRALTAVLLGSVSRGVLHHARCPVAVVRSKREAS